MPRARAMRRMLSMSAGIPKVCCTTIALVRAVMRSSTLAGSRLKVVGSISANTGLAPVASTGQGTATQVKAWMMTSSPRPIPKAFRIAHCATRPRRKWTPLAIAGAGACAAPLTGETAEQTLFSIEPPNVVADVGDVIAGDGHIHGQHEKPFKEPVREWEGLGEAEVLQVMDGLPAPLDERPNAVLL